VTDYHDMLEQLLRLRRSYPYRMGLLQGFVSSGRITQAEWEHMERQVVRRVREPKFDKGDQP